MRNLFNGVVRGLVVVSMIGALAMPASAAPRDERGAVRTIVQIVKRFIARTFGDGFSDPKPKTDPGTGTTTTTGDALGDPTP